MNRVTIDRELLERLAAPLPGDNGWQTWHTQEMIEASKELRAILAAPRQPEGEGLEVVGYGFPNTSPFGKPRMMLLAPEIPSDDQYGGAMWEPLCRLSDAQRAIAELREECKNLRDRKNNVVSECLELCDERDTLRQQLADSDAALRESRANDQAAMGHLADMRQQRDKLAGLLRDISSSESRGLDWAKQIDAALAEVDK